MALATIAGAGDLVPYRRLEFPRRSLYGALQGAFAVANLEAPLTERNDPQREGIVLRASPEVVGDLKRAGVGVTTAYSRDQERLRFEPGQPAIVHSMAWSQGLRRLRGSIQAARKRTPLVVAVLHWGVSLQEALLEYQRAVAESAVEAGASVVLGHHSHTLQGLELRGGAPVFYGLGSFVFS